MVDEDDIAYGKGQLLRAKQHLRRARKMSPDDDDSRLAQAGVWFFGSPLIISDCQQCVELSAKALFKFVGLDHPLEHHFEFRNQKTQSLFGALPEDVAEFKVARVIFLTQFWETFYNEARYGSPELNISPQEIIERKDAERAIEDADYCLGVAEEVKSAVEGDGEDE